MPVTVFGTDSFRLRALAGARGADHDDDFFHVRCYATKKGAEKLLYLIICFLFFQSCPDKNIRLNMVVSMHGKLGVDLFGGFNCHRHNDKQTGAADRQIARAHTRLHQKRQDGDNAQKQSSD